MFVSKGFLKDKKVVMFLSQDSFFLSHFISRAEKLKEEGAIVTVITNVTSTCYVSRIKDKGFEVINSEINRSGIEIINEFKSLLKLCKILRNLEPDFLHNYGSKSILYGTFASKFCKKRIAIINNLTGLGLAFCSPKWKFKFLRILLCWGYFLFLDSKYGRVISENKDDANYFLKLRAVKKEHLRIIPGAGVDIKKFTPIPWKDKSPILTVVMNARLLKSKGALVFIRAAKILDECDVPVKMLLAGGIDYKNPDSLTNRDLEITKTINCLKYLGFRSDIDRILIKSHVCVLPSMYREGIPKSLIEGCAAGLAIVTTNMPGCKETVELKNGVCLKEQDENELASVIEKLVSNKELTKLMGQRSRMLAVAKFDETKINNAILDIYRELLN